MSKNIILCADGTGNRGGSTPDTNVYRIYQSILLRDTKTPQVAYYDAGVGTSTNKYLKALSGALGFGFRTNVKDLYTYLAKMYEKGDKVFLFGFSRGAAEVRALNGMIAAAGLVDGNQLADSELKQAVDDAYKTYKTVCKSVTPKDTPHDIRNYEAAPASGKNHGAIEIHFIGIWDTVPALGFPQNWKTVSILMLVFDAVMSLMDRVFDFGWFAHRFYNYELTSKVQHVRHALAIDDERLSFHPNVFDESGPGTKDLHQVWFAGAHSDVGGGYGRTELAYVTLEWMVAHASKLGLELDPQLEGSFPTLADPTGLQHNPRDGFKLLYRFAPRNIQKLCAKKNVKTIQVHQSTIDRMQERAQQYAPGNLPRAFNIVDNPPENDEEEPTNIPVTISEDDTSSNLVSNLLWCARARILLYAVFLESVLAVLVLAIVAWQFDSFLGDGTQLPSSGTWTGNPTVLKCTQFCETTLNYFTPKMFENLIHYSVVMNPLLFPGFVLYAIILELLRRLLLFWDRTKAAPMRQLTLSSIPKEGNPRELAEPQS